VALAIILEHSFYLWKQAPSEDIKCLTLAFSVYQSSGTHATITTAINKVSMAQEHLFEEAVDTTNSRQSAVSLQLAQIAVDNCLSMPEYGVS